MAKNPRRRQTDNFPAQKRSTQGSTVSKRGRKVIAAGIGMVVLGFIVLSYTDPAGKNWASNLSPALLVAGYGLIGLGIIYPDAKRLVQSNNGSEKLTSPQKD